MEIQHKDYQRYLDGRVAHKNATHDHSFDNDRVYNSYYSFVRDKDNLQLIHDKTEPTPEPHKPSFNIKKSTGRDKTHYPTNKGKPDGPHENRFSRPDFFDKSERLSQNPSPQKLPNFEKQTGRDPSSVIKGGNMLMDLQGRSYSDYDGAWKKPDFSMKKLSTCIIDQSKQKGRDGKGGIHKSDPTEGYSYDP